MLRFLFRDLGWKLFSLGLAVLLWIFAVSEPQVSRFVAVPVQFENLPEGMEISSDVLESVHLEVRGPASELHAIDGAKDYAVVLDMSRVRPGERTFTIGPDNVRLPRGTHLVRAVPSQLRFDFERSIARDVPVRVQFGPPQPGYEVADYIVSSPTLTIVGPESRVARISVVSTDPIDLSQVVGAAEFRVTAFVQDPHVRFAESPLLIVKVQVKSRVEEPRNRRRRR